MSKVVTDDLLKQVTTDIITSLAEHMVEYEAYSEDEILGLFNLTPEEAQQLSELIRDDIVSQYKLWSSTKVNNEITLTKTECNDYTDKMVAGLSNVKLLFANSLPSVGDDNTIYIHPQLQDDGSVIYTLNVWSTEDLDWVTFGNLNIDFTQYYKKDEVDELLALKADKTEILSQDNVIVDTTLATTSNVLSATTTLDELDKKIDKDFIVTTLNKTVTDEQIPSALSVYNSITEVDEKIAKKKYNSGEYDLNTITQTGIHYFSAGCTLSNVPNNAINGWLLVFNSQGDGGIKQIWYRYGSNPNTHKDIFIRTIFGSSISDWFKIPDENNVYNLSGGTNIENNTDLDTLTTLGNYYCSSNNGASTLVNSPITKAFTLKVLNPIGKTTTRYINQILTDYYTGNVYNRQYNQDLNGWSSWKRLCAVTIKDIPTTPLTMNDSTNFTAHSGVDLGINFSYSVKNGICQVNIDLDCLVNSSVQNAFSTLLPTPSAGKYIAYILPVYVTAGTTYDRNITIVIGGNGKATIYGGTVGARYYGSFTYSVAES